MAPVFLKRLQRRLRTFFCRTCMVVMLLVLLTRAAAAAADSPPLRDEKIVQKKAAGNSIKGKLLLSLFNNSTSLQNKKPEENDKSLLDGEVPLEAHHEEKLNNEEILNNKKKISSVQSNDKTRSTKPDTTAASEAAASVAAAAAGAPVPTAAAATEATEGAEKPVSSPALGTADLNAAAVAAGAGAASASPPSEERLLPNGPQVLLARPRPLSAPFIQHYSKQMVILWEWYTKTVGATMNGKRRQDEDALVVHAPSAVKSNVRFKAVFDGHGGSAVARSCVALFCAVYGYMEDFRPKTFEQKSLLLDSLILADLARHERGGSTGLVVAIERPDDRVPRFKVHVSNVGDSRAFILHKDGTYTIMSKDHKPNDPEEVARITRAGGFVSRVRKVYRVDGSLSLSRAFGDIRMKANPNLPATEQKIVAVPDVRTFEAFEGDYIFMACDGMFEAPGMGWEFVANLLFRELQSTNDNLVEAVFRMLNTAYLLGSADNISIVLTKLMNRKRRSNVVKRFSYDFSGKREFAEPQTLAAPSVYRSGTYPTPDGPVVTLF